MPAPPVGDPAKRLHFDGRIRHYWVPEDGLANMAAPTVAELTHEDTFDFSRYVPKDGVTGDPTENYIESSDITETFDAQQVGSWGEQLTVTGYKQDPDDDFHGFFGVTKVGYWVTISNADADSPKDGDAAYVRHVQNHESKPLAHTTNAKQKCRVGFASIEAPNYHAVVVGGS